MRLKDYIEEGERVLASVKTFQGAFHTTNKRVIRYERLFTKDIVEALRYTDITSVSLETKIYYWLLAVATALAIPGLILRELVWLLPIAVVVALIGIFHKKAWYQLRSLDMTEEDMKRWRVSEAYSDEAKELYQTIQEHLKPQGK